MSKSLKKLIDINRLREFKNKLVGTDSPYVQTGAVDQTVAGTKAFSEPIVGSVTGSSGSCTGNAASANIATKAIQDAAGNTITTTYATKAENNIKANNSEVVHKSGDETIAGAKTFSTGVLLTGSRALMAQTGEYTVLLRNDGSRTFLLMSDKGGDPGTWSDARPLVINNSTGVCSINGNAATATKLATARTIALSGAATGTATGFDGSGNITIPVTSLDASKLTGTASVSTTGNAASANIATKADSATNATYANWLRTSSHTDYLFHTEWDGTYFWAYVTTGSGEYRAVRVARSDSAAAADCVQTQNNGYYHAIRFDWDYQVPGYVGLRVDTTDLGGIVTTNRLVSDIRAQWYAAYPDGAEAHNAMWGGRDITDAFNNGTVSANIANGTFRDIFPGDYITKQVTISGTTYTVNWVIADCDYWINKGDQNNGMETHHVVIVPQVPIFTANMNATNTTEGGYAGSRMYRETIPACATGIVNAFGSDHILTFRDSIVKVVNTSSISSGVPFRTGASSDWGWYDAQCNLMCERMVYGMPAFSSSAWDAGVATRQMSAFRLSERLINYNRQWWWLRDVAFSAFFAHVSGAGNAYTGGASDVYGVRPFALLK